jgi:hypothetical protein
MGFADPLMFAVQAAGLSDHRLFKVIQQIVPNRPVSVFEQAALDEAQIRGLLTGSEVRAIASPPAIRSIAKSQLPSLPDSIS